MRDDKANPAGSEWTHEAFLAAWRAGAAEPRIAPEAAASFISARLLLPFVAIAVIGLGIALVLWGWMWLGLAVRALGIGGPRLVKRSAAGLPRNQLAADPELFSAGVRIGAIEVALLPDHGGNGSEKTSGLG